MFSFASQLFGKPRALQSKPADGEEQDRLQRRLEELQATEGRSPKLPSIFRS